MFHVVQRKALYALLAELFSYPEAQHLVTLGAPETAALAALLDLKVPAAAIDAPLAELQTAYTSLFINRRGGVPAPPYGSVYLDHAGGLMGETTAKVAEWYAAMGLRQEAGGEPADHLATELEFLFYLVEREEVALERRDPAAARAATLDQARFFAGLFAPWVGQFCSRLCAAEPLHPCYRFAAELFRAFLAGEERWLKALHPLPFNEV